MCFLAGKVRDLFVLIVTATNDLFSVLLEFGLNKHAATLQWLGKLTLAFTYAISHVIRAGNSRDSARFNTNPKCIAVVLFLCIQTANIQAHMILYICSIMSGAMHLTIYGLINLIATFLRTTDFY